MLNTIEPCFKSTKGGQTMMTYYDYVEFFNSPESLLSPDEEYTDWLELNCPEPTDTELANEEAELWQ